MRQATVLKTRDHTRLPSLSDQRPGGDETTCFDLGEVESRRRRASIMMLCQREINLPICKSALTPSYSR
jgi:hypothetical protein